MASPALSMFSVTWLKTLVCKGNQNEGAVGRGHRTNTVRRI